MLILGAAVRFIHFALFDGTLLSLHYYVVDSAICLAFGLIGFQRRACRANGQPISLDQCAERPAALAPQGALT